VIVASRDDVTLSFPVTRDVARWRHTLSRDTDGAARNDRHGAVAPKNTEQDFSGGNYSNDDSAIFRRIVGRNSNFYVIVTVPVSDAFRSYSVFGTTGTYLFYLVYFRCRKERTAITVSKLVGDSTRCYSEVRKSPRWFPALHWSLVWFLVQLHVILKKSTVDDIW